MELFFSDSSHAQGVVLIFWIGFFLFGDCFLYFVYYRLVYFRGAVKQRVLDLVETQKSTMGLESHETAVGSHTAIKK